MIYFEGAEAAVNLTHLFEIGYTIHSDTLIYKFFTETYSNKECTIQQCHRARRSLDDLMEIANTYFPGSTEQDVINALNEAKVGNGLMCLTFVCNDVKKSIFMYLRETDMREDYGYRFFGNMSIMRQDDVEDTSNSKYTKLQILEYIKNVPVLEKA